MKKFIILIMILFISLSLMADWVEISENKGKELFEILTSDINSTELQFTLDGYKLETIDAEGTTFQKISFWNEGKFLEVGKPDLPRFSRLIIIPNSGEVTIEINYLEDEIISDMNIYPQQELQSESQIKDKTFVKNESFYSGKETFPGKVVELSEPAIMRDYRVVNVTINPFQYNPQNMELRVIKNIEVTINCTGNTGSNVKLHNRKKSRFFSSCYRSSIINYGSISLRSDDFQSPCYLFIYPDDATVESNLQYLIDWKHQKGFEVVAANTSETGSTLSEIKDYIQDAYDTWENPPEFICLVGDAGGNFSIPTGHIDGGVFNGEGDQFYTLLEGDDILADVFIGRLSFNSILEFQTIISKILNYEKEPYMGQTNWYNTALLVGDPTDSGPSCIDTKQHIKEMININAPDISCIEVYDTALGSWVSQMNNALNAGVSYFNYRGFVYMSGWNNNSTNNLNNGYMLPVVVSLTCLTGDFEGTADCISEGFLKAGSPGLPKGGIAAIATATGYSHTCFNNCIDAGIFYGIFVDQIYHLGGALNRGKLNLYTTYPGNPGNHVNQFSYWNNLMGDPGMEIWTGIPQEIVVIYDSQVAIGTNFLEVTVQDNNDIPLENAWVTALKGDDEIFATGLTDGNGSVILPLEAINTGEVTLTVTKHNCIPHLGSFDIAQSDRFVNVYEYQIDDDNSGTSSGNGDGYINPGEDIELNVSLENFGSLTANSVVATISSENNFITITDDIENYGNIPSGSSVYSSDDFDFSVHPDVLGGTEIELNIHIEDNIANEWNDKIYLTVEGANLNFEEYTITDTINGILDPGETVELIVTLENIGTEPIDGVYGTLACENNMITINDSVGYFGFISAAGTASNSSNTYEITASTQVLPGTQIIMNLQLYNVDGYDNTINFILEVGEVNVTDPLGPDGYGYYCYDDDDLGYYNTPIYQWIEIDPTYGGTGTIIPLVDFGNMGDTEVVNLPFNLKFYGENYSNITICSNGWITPGVTELNSFMNWNIPGPLGPSPIIAPFWDDLKIGTGNVCYFYDDVSHYFIVEWSRLQNEYDNSEETFEVIIYDQNYYPTSTGDNQLLFQYNVINNVDLGSYGTPLVAHGQYATVGLEDHTSTIGLEYTYNNYYPIAAKPLENEMALLFTGPPIQQIEPYIVLGGITINDANGNGIIDYAEFIELDITLNNIGENSATGISTVLTCSDSYITLIENSSSYDNIVGGSSGLNLTPYSFDVAEDCPDGHNAPFLLSVTSNEDTWEIFFNLVLNAPLIEFMEIFVDDGNNHMLDPGETADVHVTFINNGGSDAYSVISTLSMNDVYVTLNSTTSNIGSFSAGTMETAVFNLTANSNAPIQHEATISWEITADYSYESCGDFPLFIAQIPVSLIENFYSFLPLGWSIEGGTNWIVSYSNFAGGTIPEAAFIWYPPIVGTQRLITMPIITLGSNELELEFKHALYDISGGYTISVETSSNGSNWNTVATWSAQNLPATTENFIISTPDVGSSTFQLAFVFDGISQGINGWVIDDVILSETIISPHGYIIGNVSLDGGPGNIEEVVVTAGGVIKSPDSNGDYCIPVPQGTYDVSAILPGYITSIVEDVVVGEWETTVIDFVLYETTIADPPQNLQASLYFNDITLEWDIPGSDNDNEGLRISTKIDRNNGIHKSDFDSMIKRNPHFPGNRSLLGYKVYCNGEEIAEITDILTTTYTDFGLDAGEYSYYVTAIYNDGESDPSNIEIVTVTLPPPTNLTYQVNAGNMVILQWLPPEGEPSRNWTGFNVYRDDAILYEDLSQLFYIDLNVPVGIHTYYITALYYEYESGPSNGVIVEITSTEDSLIPLKTKLGNNFPNPFNPSGAGRSPRTTITFALKDAGHVYLEIFNIKGEKVKTLFDEKLEPGYHSVEWNGRNSNSKPVSSGIYFYRLKAGKEFFQTRRMLLLK